MVWFSGMILFPLPKLPQKWCSIQKWSKLTLRKHIVLLVLHRDIICKPLHLTNVTNYVRIVMTNYQTDNIKLERWKPNSYTNDWSMSGVDCLRLDLENLLEREHVVVQVLEDGRAFPEDTVPAEDRVILLRNDFFTTVLLNCYFTRSSVKYCYCM